MKIKKWRGGAGKALGTRWTRAGTEYLYSTRRSVVNREQYMNIGFKEEFRTYKL